jgi:hypothetical protein
MQHCPQNLYNDYFELNKGGTAWTFICSYPLQQTEGENNFTWLIITGDERLIYERDTHTHTHTYIYIYAYIQIK